MGFEYAKVEAQPDVYDSSQLTLGGLPLGHFGKDVLGYVDMVNPSGGIYLNADALKYNSSIRSVEYHEYGHIVQKEYLQTKAPLGPPSYSNPLATSLYLQELFELNRKLELVMPKATNGSSSSFDGLESAAECYTEAKLMEIDLLRMFQPHYFEAKKDDRGRVVEPTCSSLQRAVSMDYSLLETHRW